MPTLPPVPDSYFKTMTALHVVAERVLSPVRVAAEGADHTQLTPWPGGFGTPELPGGGRAGVIGTDLVVVDADGEHRVALALDAGAAEFLATVYEFAQTALDALRADGAVDASPTHLWPEHFDIAFDQGAEQHGARAGYGVSPGDENHGEPYAYVGPWVAQAGPLWQATGFPGAELNWSELAGAADPLAALLGFWRSRRDALAAARSSAAS